MTEVQLTAVAPYGVTGIGFGGCIEGSPIHPGQPGAMRRSAHAHNVPGDPNYGVVCFKALGWGAVRASLFWHEVGHIWRRSWTEGQCNTWAKKRRGVRRIVGEGPGR